MSAAAAGGGRTEITTRALERVTAAVAGEAFGSAGDRVQVDLSDYDGALDVAITCGVRAVSLARVIADPRSVGRAGGSLLEQAATAEDTIRHRVADLTGRTVRQVELRLTSVHIQQEKRVR